MSTKSVLVAIRMTPKLKEIVDEMAHKHTITVTKYIMRALVEHLSKEKGIDKDTLYREIL